MNSTKETPLTCRLCLKNDPNNVGIFDEIGLRGGLLVKIWRLFGFVVTIDDETPKRICGSCLPQLEACISFKSKIEDAQLKLQLSKLVCTSSMDRSSSVDNTNNHSGLVTHSSPLQQPSTYGWDTITVADNCSSRTYVSNSSVISNSNDNPNKNTAVLSCTVNDMPVAEANKSLPFSCGEENIKEVTQLWDRLPLDTSQDYLMNVDEQMSNAILDQKYEDILSLCTMQDGQGLIKQFPTEDMRNCTWSSDVIDDKKLVPVQLSENKLIGDYVTYLASGPLTANLPNTRSISTQTSITSVHYCSLLTYSKQSSPLQTSSMSSKSTTVKSIVDTDRIIPHHEENTDMKNPALDDGSSIPCNLWETNVTVDRSSFTNKNRTLVNKQLVDFYKMTCQDCPEKCVTFSMLQRHTKAIHSKKAFVNCCGIQMSTRQALINHLEKHFPTQEADRSNQLEIPSTTTPNVQTTVSSVKCPQSPILTDQNTSSDIGVCKPSNPVSFLRGQEVSSSVAVLSAKQGNSPSPTVKPNIQKCYPRSSVNLEAACPICDKRFQRKSSLPKHLSSHGIRELVDSLADPKQCQFCRKIFRDESTKNYHVQLHHPRPMQQHVCIRCNIKCASRSQLKSHLASVHGIGATSPIQTYNCHLCLATLLSKKTLQAHVNAHSSKLLNVKCPFCVKEYTSKLNVKRHIKRVHAKHHVKEGQENKVDVNITDN